MVTEDLRENKEHKGEHKEHKSQNKEHTGDNEELERENGSTGSDAEKTGENTKKPRESTKPRRAIMPVGLTTSQVGRSGNHACGFNDITGRALRIWEGPRRINGNSEMAPGGPEAAERKQKEMARTVQKQILLSRAFWEAPNFVLFLGFWPVCGGCCLTFRVWCGLPGEFAPRRF